MKDKPSYAPFKDLRIEQVFRSGGFYWIKVSSRTAKLADKEYVKPVYFKQSQHVGL